MCPITGDITFQEKVPANDVLMFYHSTEFRGNEPVGEMCWGSGRKRTSEIFTFIAIIILVGM
jgi:hypothetical protein